jgi:hypothetical protein
MLTLWASQMTTISINTLPKARQIAFFKEQSRLNHEAYLRMLKINRRLRDDLKRVREEAEKKQVEEVWDNA